MGGERGGITNYELRITKEELQARNAKRMTDHEARITNKLSGRTKPNSRKELYRKE